MRSTKKIIALALLFSFPVLSIANGIDELKKGWENLIHNQFTEAKTHFDKAVLDPATKADAFLSIAIIQMGQYQNQLAFESFQKCIAASDNPDPIIFAMGSANFIQIAKTKDKILFYQNILSKPGTSGTVRAMCNEMLNAIYQEAGEASKASEAADKIGAITDWQLLGVFENISASGFNKNFGAVEHPEPDYKFINKRGAAVSWFSLPKDKMRNDRWLGFNYNFYVANSIAYAQTFVTSPTDQEVQLRLGTSGSHKVWINDHLIMSEPEERNNDLDTYNSTIKLYKGVNRILIQVGSSEIDRSNFLCRITNSKGEPLTGLTYSGKYVSYNKNYDFKGELIPVMAEEYYQTKVKNDPQNMLSHVLLVNCYLRNEKTFDAARVIRDAEKISPDFLYLLALKSENDLRSRNYSGLSTVMKKMKELVPDSYDALDLEYNEAKDGENYDKAEEVLNTIKKKYGEDEKTLDKEINIYASTKQVEKMTKLIDDSYKKYPEFQNFVIYKYTVESKMRKNNSETVKVMNDYLKNHSNSEIMEQLANHYLETNDPSSAISVMDKAIATDPYAVGYYNKVSLIYYGTGNYKKAHEYNNTCLNVAPYIGSYHESAGNIFAAENKKSDAIREYKKAIEYDPTDYDARVKLKKLENKEDAFSSFTKPDFQQMFKASPAAEAYPEDNSIILTDEEQDIVYKGGAGIEKRFIMVKVFNASGIDDWKDYNIHYYNGQRLVVDDAYIIKKTGSKVDADRNDNHIVFTGLEIGDAICLSYKIENYYSGKLAEHFTDYHYFNCFYPMINSSFKLLIDTSITFQYKVQNSDLKPEITTKDEFKSYNWTRKNQPSIKYEKGMISLADAAELLCISSYPDWNSVAKWYADLSSTKAKPDFEVKEIMRDLFEGKTNLSNLEKVKIIYDFIVNEIRYSSVSFRQSGLIPQRAVNVINTHIGDCKDVSTLFVSMCREAGFEANLVLVSTRANGDHYLFLPSIDFDHCIGSVKIDGKKYYVELTSDFNAFSTFNSALKYSQALEIIEDAKNDMISLTAPTALKNAVYRKTSVSFSGEKVTVKKNTVKTGAIAADMRDTYRDAGKEQQEKSMKSAINDEMPQIKLESIKFEKNLNSTNDSVSYEFVYSSEDPFSDVGGISIFKIPFSETIYSMSILAEDKRNYTLRSWKSFDADEEIEKMDVTLPAGKTLMKLPESKTFTSEFGDYTLTCKQVGNSLTLTRTFRLKGNGLVPPDKYNDYKSFFQKIIKADAVQLALK